MHVISVMSSGTRNKIRNSPVVRPMLVLEDAVAGESVMNSHTLQCEMIRTGTLRAEAEGISPRDSPKRGRASSCEDCQDSWRDRSAETYPKGIQGKKGRLSYFQVAQ